MVKVITYGTYDLLHYGHIRLLERAKALGDYLIVGVTADDFDKTRGKINVQQPLSERIEAVRATGIADEIIVEEYEGQKIDDINRYDIDIFTVGSDWVGKFDYLNEYCKVVYLDRTQGISSSELRDKKRSIRFGLYGDSVYLNKIYREAQFVNGIDISGICTNNIGEMSEEMQQHRFVTGSYDELLENSDAVYIVSYPQRHYEDVKKAINHGKHVICESPIAMSSAECKELLELAKANGCVLMDGIKTAYATAYYRLLLLIKSGKIGQVVSVDSTCTSIRQYNSNPENSDEYWSGFTAWAPTALLPIFQILGTEYKRHEIVSAVDKDGKDGFSKLSFIYDNAVATAKVGSNVKSEGELVISGTKGYVYVPAPWWKTDYFEIRYENPADNRRYFYQLDGEGIRYELASFAKLIDGSAGLNYIYNTVSETVAGIMGDFLQNKQIIKVKSL